MLDGPRAPPPAEQELLDDLRRPEGGPVRHRCEEFAGDVSVLFEVDVRQVDLIDSVGISFLVRLAASARDHGQAMTLRGPAPRVQQLLTLVGADVLFTWSDGP